MIENNIKTALLASLTVALLIPISLMDSSNAEKVTDSLAIPNAERDLKLAAGYKLYPGVGWVAPEEQNRVEPIYVENPNNPGEMILNIDAMIEEQKRLEEAKIKKTSGNFFQDIYNQLVQLADAALTSYHIAAKTDSSNNITYQRAFWQVPISPGTYNGGTNFNFNAIQPDPSSTIIFQPVLQHGFSSWCDAGNDWVTYPFIFVAGSPYGGNCIDADDGDVIRGTISKGANNVWTIAVYNYDNPDANDSYSVMSSTTMKMAFVAVETHNIPTNCSELEGDVEYYAMSTTGDVDNWAAASQGSTFCGMSTNIVSDSKVQFNNNN